MNHLDPQKLPRHVAIIMDGNGRWAKQRNLPRIAGHQRGAKVIDSTVEAARECGIQYLTLYAFSVENWNRPKVEIKALMGLLETYLKNNFAKLLEEKIRLKVIGRYRELPKHIQELLQKTEEATAEFDSFTLCLALNYGARTEIVDAVRKLAKDASEGTLEVQDLNYEMLQTYLYTDGIPDPDLMIRTSGESRLSNFLLLQSAYSEIIFCSELWPDFGSESFKNALAEYASRERRYGKTTEQIVSSASDA